MRSLGKHDSPRGQLILKVPGFSCASVYPSPFCETTVLTGILPLATSPTSGLLEALHWLKCTSSALSRGFQPCDPGLYLLSVSLICVKAGGL